MRRRGSILVALLWCLALLSVVVIGILHSSRMSLTSARHHGDSVQARYLALAGIEKAKALLYQDARNRMRAAQSHGRTLADAPNEFRDIQLGRGRYSVVRAARDDEGGGVVYGVGDEDGRLNVNTASAEELSKLRGMTPDVVAALIDWRDGDNAPGAGGAEAEYYLAGPTPMQVRNGPFETMRELLMVRGVSTELLFGEDARGIGLLEVDEPGSTDGSGPALEAAVDRGWAESLTVHSIAANVNASGQSRVNLKTADESALTGVRGITTDIARAIVAHRGRGRGQFESLADLLEVRRAPAGGAPGSPGAPGGPGGPAPSGAVPGQGVQIPGGPQENNGPKVIDANLLRDIADDVTMSDDEDLIGLVNVNSASVDVLACLPGVTRELGQAIVSYRSSAGFLPNVAHLLLVPGMSEELFKGLAPRVTTRSETYRLIGEGRLPGTGAVKRLEMVVRVTGSDVRTVAYREDDL